MDHGVHRLPAMLGDLADLGALLLLGQKVLGDGAAWPVEDRHVVLDAKAKIGVLVERPLLGGVDVGGLQAYRLVAVSLGQLDAAVPLAQKWIKGVQSNT